ncbi:MAG: hypothetical protein BGP16_05345 [Sphingobium sp. 66-54]|nr:MAG: hypothetical protein BGP16_05345 [Sphingobium sp. 66-54]
MAGKFAATTDVPVSKMRFEIEALVEKYGAGQFMSAYDADRGFIGFTMKDRQVRFAMTLPNPGDKEFTHFQDRYGYEKRRTDESARKQWEQACRSRWRALLLVIKAKLEAVEVGISTFDTEFMANIVMPDGSLIGDHVVPRIAQAYKTGTMPPLLPDQRGGGK